MRCWYSHTSMITPFIFHNFEKPVSGDQSNQTFSTSIMYGGGYKWLNGLQLWYYPSASMGGMDTVGAFQAAGIFFTPIEIWS